MPKRTTASWGCHLNIPGACCSSLTLAACVPSCLPARPLPTGKAQVTVASLAEMRASHKGGDDPEPQQADQRLPADVLWSDPGREPGVQLGARPGDVGIVFGPDVTEVGAALAGPHHVGGGCAAGLWVGIAGWTLVLLGCPSSSPSLQHITACPGPAARSCCNGWAPQLAQCPALRFPPGCLQAFLRDNGLRLILRGHEGALPLPTAPRPAAFLARSYWLRGGSSREAAAAMPHARHTSTSP